MKETKAPAGYIKSNNILKISPATDPSSGKDFVIEEVVEGDNGEEVALTSIDDSIFTIKQPTESADAVTKITVTNRKPSYPSTGGNGPKIAFAILGTATMLAAIAYYAIYQKDKNKIYPSK